MNKFVLLSTQARLISIRNYRLTASLQPRYHLVDEYINNQVYKYGIESILSILKHALYGALREISPKRLQLHVNEFSGGHFIRFRGLISGLLAAFGQLITLRILR